MIEKRHKQGDVREDGLIFWQYVKSCKNGERWVTAEKFAEYREKRKARIREKYANDPEYREKKKAREREKYANDPEYREKENARKLDRYHEKCANDPEYREKINARRRDRLANDPECREKENARRREKYANDPEWREKENARRRDRVREKMANDPEWREKRKAQRRDWLREKYANDPEYREKKNARRRDNQREKMANDPELREKKNAWNRDWRREKYANDPEYRAMAEVRNLVGRVEKGGKRSLEIYGVPSKEWATKIRRGRIRIYNKYFKGVEKHLDHIRPLAEVKHSIEELHKRSHFTNLLYIPAKENMSKGATPFWDWFAGLKNKKLIACIAEQDAYNKKIQLEIQKETL